MHAFVNQSFTLHLHGNIWTVSVFRFKKRLLAKAKKKCLKSLSKSHSCPCWVFQTRHTSKFCSAKKMAETPCFVSVLLLEESFAVTYHNSRVRRVNSFQTSLFFTQDYEIYFFDPQEEVIWHILSKSLCITGAISKFSQSCQIGGVGRKYCRDLFSDWK